MKPQQALTDMELADPVYMRTYVEQLNETIRELLLAASAAPVDARTFKLPEIGALATNLETGKVELYPAQYREALERYARAALIQFAEQGSAAPGSPQDPISMALTEELVRRVGQLKRYVLSGGDPVHGHIETIDLLLQAALALKP